MEVGYARVTPPAEEGLEPTVEQLATVRWVEGSIAIEADDDEVRAGLERAFRRTPVVVDDGAYRRQGTSGPVVVQPGDLEWFRAVAQVRAPAETGLAARFVPGVTEGGYDPAAGYRGFNDQIERLHRHPDEQ
jgi:hypothetical protein